MPFKEIIPTYTWCRRCWIFAFFKNKIRKIIILVQQLISWILLIYSVHAAYFTTLKHSLPINLYYLSEIQTEWFISSCAPVEDKSAPQRTYGAAGENTYSSYSFSTSALDGMSGQPHATLYPRGNNPRYPLNRRLGGPQSRSGQRS
jgi:hypothetical protein